MQINTCPRCGLEFEHKKSLKLERGNKEEYKETSYLTVKDWVKKHPWPGYGGLRNLIFKRKTNGFETAFINFGRRVLIDEKEFFKCIENKREVK